MARLINFMLILSIKFYFSMQNNWKHLDLSCCENHVSLDALCNVPNETVVTLGNCTYTLTSPLTISAVQGLHIIGNDSVINCTGDKAGIKFKMVTNLLLEKLTIRNCEFRTVSYCGRNFRKKKLQIHSVKVENCSNVAVRNVSIENGTGTGLSLLGVGGNVTVEDSIFRHNRYYDQMYGVFSARDTDFFQRGGGIQICYGQYLKSPANYQILNCKFLYNYASSGGGMFVVIRYGAENVHINIKDSDFIQNSCQNDGGGIQLGYTSTDTSNNSITLDGCLFKNNTAGYGGGVSIFSSLNRHKSMFIFNNILLNNCFWSQNVATRNGMAVDISTAPWETITGHSFVPKFQFLNCNFTEHSPTKSLSSSSSTFTVTGYNISFKQQNVFERNNGTAIDAISAILSIDEKAEIYFLNNQGINGGAIRLTGLSVILVRNSSTFIFQGNKALKMGGAIYVDSSKRHSSSTCFIKKIEGTIEQPLFRFSNNTASFEDGKNSIFTSSILSCLKECSNGVLHNLSVTEAMKCIGTFQFDETSTGQLQLSSAPHHFSENTTSKQNDSLCDVFVEDSIIYSKQKDGLQLIDNHSNRHIPQKLLVIPGRRFEIPLKLVDELCEEVVFRVSVKVQEQSDGSMFTNDSLITKNNIRLYGNPRDYGLLKFSAPGVHGVTMSVQLDNCPPGYIHESMSCVCSLDTKLHYPGIERCSQQEYKAYAKHGYWLGYVNNQTTQETLASAICPRGFCVKNTTEYPLPSEATLNTSSHICNRRTGTICGSCKANNSTYYRSASFLCKSIHLCYLGWLFYILSEIVPVTVLFFLVIYFNISFTSGALNGVIFFMQIVDTLKIEGEYFISFGDTVLHFSRLYKIVYRVFLLKFFALEELSFCLWEGATALDMLAIRYITIVYSLFLVIVTVVILRKCTCKIGTTNKKPPLNLKHSILNGLSAFLVMSYSECTQVTLMILTAGTLTVGPIESVYTTYRYESVAFYNGNYQYMGPEHLKYALPAVAFLLTLVALPPILLIVYPLCYKLFALLKIDESKLVKIICKVVPLEKIKPLFDSIQGEFKDKYRFFAGLYFLYRLCASFTFTYASDLKYYYFATNIQLVFVLLLHSLCWPYKKRWHNVLDAILFGHLALINAMASINYASRNQSIVVNLAGIQCGFILFPLVYLVVYTIYNIVIKIKAKKTSSAHQDIVDIQKNDNSSNDVLEMLDTRRVEDFDNYFLLNESKN